MLKQHHRYDDCAEVNLLMEAQYAGKVHDVSNHTEDRHPDECYHNAATPTHETALRKLV